MSFGWLGTKELKQHSLPPLVLLSLSLFVLSSFLASFLSRLSLPKVNRILSVKIQFHSEKGLQSNLCGLCAYLWTKPRAQGTLLAIWFVMGERWGPGLRIPPGAKAQIPKPKDRFCYMRGKDDWKGHNNTWPHHTKDPWRTRKARHSCLTSRNPRRFCRKETSSYPHNYRWPVLLLWKHHKTHNPVSIEATSSTSNFRCYVGAWPFLLSLMYRKISFASS